MSAGPQLVAYLLHPGVPGLGVGGDERVVSSARETGCSCKSLLSGEGNATRHIVVPYEVTDDGGRLAVHVCALVVLRSGPPNSEVWVTIGPPAFSGSKWIVSKLKKAAAGPRNGN